MSYISGITLQELNFLEEEFLDIIDFKINVSTEEYYRYKDGLDTFFNQPLKPETVQIIEEIQ